MKALVIAKKIEDKDSENNGAPDLENLSGWVNITLGTSGHEAYIITGTRENVEEQLRRWSKIVAKIELTDTPENGKYPELETKVTNTTAAKFDTLLGQPVPRGLTVLEMMRRFHPNFPRGFDVKDPEYVDPEI